MSFSPLKYYADQVDTQKKHFETSDYEPFIHITNQKEIVKPINFIIPKEMEVMYLEDKDKQKYYDKLLVNRIEKACDVDIGSSSRPKLKAIPQISEPYDDTNKIENKYFNVRLLLACDQINESKIFNNSKTLDKIHSLSNDDDVESMLIPQNYNQINKNSKSLVTFFTSNKFIKLLEKNINKNTEYILVVEKVLHFNKENTFSPNINSRKSPATSNSNHNLYKWENDKKNEQTNDQSNIISITFNKFYQNLCDCSTQLMPKSTYIPNPCQGRNSLKDYQCKENNYHRNSVFVYFVEMKNETNYSKNDRSKKSLIVNERKYHNIKISNQSPFTSSSLKEIQSLSKHVTASNLGSPPFTMKFSDDRKNDYLKKETNNTILNKRSFDLASKLSKVNNTEGKGKEDFLLRHISNSSVKKDNLGCHRESTLDQRDNKITYFSNQYKDEKSLNSVIEILDKLVDKFIDSVDSKCLKAIEKDNINILMDSVSPAVNSDNSKELEKDFKDTHKPFMSLSQLPIKNHIETASERSTIINKISTLLNQENIETINEIIEAIEKIKSKTLTELSISKDQMNFVNLGGLHDPSKSKTHTSESKQDFRSFHNYIFSITDKDEHEGHIKSLEDIVTKIERINSKLVSTNKFNVMTKAGPVNHIADQESLINNSLNKPNPALVVTDQTEDIIIKLIERNSTNKYLSEIIITDPGCDKDLRHPVTKDSITIEVTYIPNIPYKDVSSIRNISKEPDILNSDEKLNKFSHSNSIKSQPLEYNPLLESISSHTMAQNIMLTEKESIKNDITIKLIERNSTNKYFSEIKSTDPGCDKDLIYPVTKDSITIEVTYIPNKDESSLGNIAKEPDILNSDENLNKFSHSNSIKSQSLEYNTLPESISSHTMEQNIMSMEKESIKNDLVSSLISPLRNSESLLSKNLSLHLKTSENDVKELPGFSDIYQYTYGSSRETSVRNSFSTLSDQVNKNISTNDKMKNVLSAKKGSDTKDSLQPVPNLQETINKVIIESDSNFNKHVPSNEYLNYKFIGESVQIKKENKPSSHNVTLEHHDPSTTISNENSLDQNVVNILTSTSTRFPVHENVIKTLDNQNILQKEHAKNKPSLHSISLEHSNPSTRINNENLLGQDIVNVLTSTTTRIPIHDREKLLQKEDAEIIKSQYTRHSKEDNAHIILRDTGRSLSSEHYDKILSDINSLFRQEDIVSRKTTSISKKFKTVNSNDVNPSIKSSVNLRKKIQDEDNNDRDKLHKKSYELKDNTLLNDKNIKANDSTGTISMSMNKHVFEKTIISEYSKIRKDSETHRYSNKIREIKSGNQSVQNALLSTVEKYRPSGIHDTSTLSATKEKKLTENPTSINTNDDDNIIFTTEVGLLFCGKKNIFSILNKALFKKNIRNSHPPSELSPETNQLQMVNENPLRTSSIFSNTARKSFNNFEKTSQKNLSKKRERNFSIDISIKNNKVAGSTTGRNLSEDIENIPDDFTHKSNENFPKQTDKNYLAPPPSNPSKQKLQYFQRQPSPNRSSCSGLKQKDNNIIKNSSDENLSSKESKENIMQSIVSPKNSVFSNEEVVSENILAIKRGEMKTVTDLGEESETKLFKLEIGLNLPSTSLNEDDELISHEEAPNRFGNLKVVEKPHESSDILESDIEVSSKYTLVSNIESRDTMTEVSVRINNWNLERITSKSIDHENLSKENVENSPRHFIASTSNVIVLESEISEDSNRLNLYSTNTKSISEENLSSQVQNRHKFNITLKIIHSYYNTPVSERNTFTESTTSTLDSASSKVSVHLPSSIGTSKRASGFVKINLKINDNLKVKESVSSLKQSKEHEFPKSFEQDLDEIDSHIDVLKMEIIQNVQTSKCSN